MAHTDDCLRIWAAEMCASLRKNKTTGYSKDQGKPVLRMQTRTSISLSLPLPSPSLKSQSPLLPRSMVKHSRVSRP